MLLKNVVNGYRCTAAVISQIVDAVDIGGHILRSSPGGKICLHRRIDHRPAGPDSFLLKLPDCLEALRNGRDLYDRLLSQKGTNGVGVAYHSFCIGGDRLCKDQTFRSEQRTDFFQNFDRVSSCPGKNGRVCGHAVYGVNV